MKASFHQKNATVNSENHMMRKSKVTYLISYDEDENEYLKKKKAEEALAAARRIAKEKTGRKMQQKAVDVFVKEAVLNVKEDTTIEDIEKLFDALKKEFGGFDVFDIAIHKDEGYFFNTIDKLNYRPGKDIFYNKTSKKWHLESGVIPRMNTFRTMKNLHAHVRYSLFDEGTGKSVRLSRADMRKIQDMTADILAMERGKKGARRQEPRELKAIADAKRAKKEELLELERKYKKEREKLIESHRATQEDYVLLKKKKEEIESKLIQSRKENKQMLGRLMEVSLHEYELEEELEGVKNENKELLVTQTSDEELKALKSEVRELKEENSSLKKKIARIKDIFHEFWDEKVPLLEHLKKVAIFARQEFLHEARLKRLEREKNQNKNQNKNRGMRM